MTTRVHMLFSLALLLGAASTWSQEKPQENPAPAAVPGELPAHVKVAYTFLTGWGKGNWDEVKPVAAEQVTVKVGDKAFTLDLAGGKADIALVFPFKGIATVRVEGKVKGVTVEEIGLKTGETEKRGKGALTLEEKDGQFLVTGVAVE